MSEEDLSIAEKWDIIVKESGRKGYSRFVLATLGVVPWVGGALAAFAALDAEAVQSEINELQRQWLDEHERKLEDLRMLISSVVERLDEVGRDIDERVNSEEYLHIVRRAFRSFDQADTVRRRNAIRNILVNAACIDICHDNVVLLFAEWINIYSDFHFDVISAIYNKNGITRSEVWQITSGGGWPEESSAEADLFKLLYRDLSTGGVIRQHREVDYKGDFVKKITKKKGQSGYTSAFDASEGYELTNLGQQFVHYVLTDNVTMIADENG